MRMSMKLDIKDRLIISNQLKILEKLYPEEANYYSKHRTAIEQGYQLHYPWLVEHFYEEMSEVECKEILDILDMYRAITFASKKVPDLAEVDDHWLKFKGFDGNNESKQLAYAQYFIVDLERYEELKYGMEFPSLNSHSQTLPKYRRMLEHWEAQGKSFELSKEALISLLKA